MPPRTLSALILATLTTLSYAQTTPPQAPRTSDSASSDNRDHPQPAASAQQPPKYTTLRYDEDYSYLNDPANRTDFFDPVKYIPLGIDSNSYASVGGQARYRYEYFNHNNFGAGPQDEDGYHLARFLAHADLHVTEYFRAFVEGKSAYEWGRNGGPRPSVADEYDIQQLFVDARLPLGDASSATLRVGRQELQYGATRLIAASDWTNVRRTFDGAKLMFNCPSNSLDLFLVRPVLVEREQLNDGDPNTTFAGAYDTLKLPQLLGPNANSGLDLYALSLNKTATPTAADSETYTLGTRLFSKPKPFDLDVEFAYQFGDAGHGGDVSAWTVGSEFGYTLEHVAYAPRAFLGFDIASGDDNPANPDRGNFNPLFPNGHPFFGYTDILGRSNIIDLHPGLDLTLLENRTLAKKVTFRAEHHIFWRENTHDGLYSTTGSLFRASSASANASSVGSELDLLLNWQVDRHLLLYAGYSHFFAGDFLDQSGPSQDVDFLYLAATYTF